MNTIILLFIALVLIICTVNVEAGLGLGALCSTGCAAVVVACYSAAGATFGTITAGAGTPAVILACNAAFGKCMATCAGLTLTPTP